MATTISDFGGMTQKVLRLPDPSEQTWSAFNPSIGYAKKAGYAMLFRSSNYLIDERTGIIRLLFGTTIKSRIWFSELDEDLNLVGLREVKFDHQGAQVRRGVEDPRLFWRDDSWYFSAVMLEAGHTPRARMTVYRLDTETMVATFVEKLETPSANVPEKNWMAPDVATSAFDFVYSFRKTYKDGTLEDIPDSSRLPKYRGGSGLVLQDDGTYLAVVHQVDVDESRKINPRTFGVEVLVVRDYWHRFVRYDSNGRLIEHSDQFIFESTGIEYAAGLVEHGEDLVISYGKKDCASYLARVPKSTVVGMLNKVVDITQNTD